MRMHTRAAAALSGLALAAAGATVAAPAADAATSGSNCSAWATTGLTGVKGRTCGVWNSTGFTVKTQAYNSGTVTRYLKGYVKMSNTQRSQWNSTSPQHTVASGAVVTLASTTLYGYTCNGVRWTVLGKIIKASTSTTEWMQTRSITC